MSLCYSRLDLTLNVLHILSFKRFFRQLKVPLIRPDDRWFEVHRLIVDDEKQVQAVCLATQIVLSYRFVFSPAF